MNSLANEVRILKFHKFFLMPREQFVQIPPVLINSITSLQKSNDMKTFNVK
jgi:hypothetical protein